MVVTIDDWVDSQWVSQESSSEPVLNRMLLGQFSFLPFAFFQLEIFQRSPDLLSFVLYFIFDHLLQTLSSSQTFCEQKPNWRWINFSIYKPTLH